MTERVHRLLLKQASPSYRHIRRDENVAAAYVKTVSANSFTAFAVFSAEAHMHVFPAWCRTGNTASRPLRLQYSFRIAADRRLIRTAGGAGGQCFLEVCSVFIRTFGELQVRSCPEERTDAGICSRSRKVF